MSYELGEFTRQRYSSFLPPLYSQDWFRAYSTDDDATLMSCEATLAALFWPKREENWNPSLPWQPIPVHLIPEEILRRDLDCPAYYMEIDHLLNTDPIFQVINMEYADTFEYIKNNSGYRLLFGKTAASFYDILYVEDILGLKLPEWTKSVYPEPLNFIAESSLKALFHTDQLKRFGE